VRGALLLLVALASACDVPTEEGPRKPECGNSTYKWTIPNVTGLNPFESEWGGGYAIKGYTPSGGGRFPLYIYFTGTTNNHGTLSNMDECAYMANKGFVAVEAEYASSTYPLSCNALVTKARTMFGADQNSVISVLCRHPSVDCNSGIATSGFSQGAHMAVLANGFEKRVTAAYLIGNGNQAQNFLNFQACLNYGTNGVTIDTSRIRSVVGEHDQVFGCDYAGGSCGRPGVRAQQVATSGRTDCPAPAYNCLRSDGSGYYVVSDAESSLPTAVHCVLWATNQCGTTHTAAYKNSVTRWGQNQNLDWLAARSRALVD